ncbi:hypothetical protein KW791_02755, partial [Candidatus Parcubacteria bacterium]|nr:hypothetical protein [Candidatus Parcubacteria bacterium]
NSASDHQMQNAVEFSKHGASLVEEANMTPHIILNQVQSLINHSSEASSRIKTFAKPDAASNIASALLS